MNAVGGFVYAWRMNEKIENVFLEAALRYNAAGFSVIPIRPRDKAPMWKGWEKYSTAQSTIHEIEAWWEVAPNANVGIALGPANGVDGRYLFVVDQDVLKDENRMPILNPDGGFEQMGDIRGCPATLSQTTGSGGKQLFYWAPRGCRVGNSKPRPLIDVKGFAGQVLVPPSIHPNGNSYAWDIDELLPENIAEFPQDSLDTLLKVRAPSESSVRKILAGVPIGQGLRHIGIAQVAGYYLRKAQTPEEIEMARIALYAWDKEMNKSPERREERKRELDNTFEGILAREMARPDRRQQRWNATAAPRTSKPIFASYSDIQSEPIRWLWPERIALGKLTLIIGDPNVGKSLLTATIAATASMGGLWPVDKTHAPLGDSILLSAEDDAADTVKPRLDAAGADSRRVHTLQAIRDENADGSQSERMFSIKRDLEALEEMLASFPECKLVIIDPLSAYLDETDSHRNAAVRGLLAPLAAFGAKHKIAIVAVDHLNKNSREGNSLYRASGSLAFVAAARAVYLVTRDKDNPNRRLLLPVKNNIAKENTGLAYTIITAENGAPVTAWESDLVQISANDALAELLDSGKDDSDADWDADVLRDVLSSGPVPAKQVFDECVKAGVSKKQARNAAKKLGVNQKKTSFDGGWAWSLPGTEDAQRSEDSRAPAEGTLGEGKDEKAPDPSSFDF